MSSRIGDRQRVRSTNTYNVKEDISNYPQHSKIKRTTLLQLPLNLICDILSWLPEDTTFICKCVCKTFLDVLRDPYFAKLHLARSSDIDYRLIIPQTVSPFNFCLLPIPDLERSASQSRGQTLAMPSTLPQPTIYMSLIGSYNGLVCMRYLSRHVIDICVCNPILGEFMMLPQPWPRVIEIIFGFGFCPNTKHYKVIRFQSGLPCEIYTLGRSEWRTVGNAPRLEFPIISMDSSPNGILHCVVSLVTDIGIRNKICSFNLETEQFSHISLPPHIENETPKTITCMKTGILDGLLCLYYVVDGTHLEIYVMKQYGVEESWIKTLRFDCAEQIYAVKVLNYKGLVFIYNYKTIFHYNSLVGIVRKLNVHMPFQGKGYYPDFSEATAQVPNFISLKHIAGEENVEFVRRTKLTSDNKVDSSRDCDKFTISKEIF